MYNPIYKCFTVFIEPHANGNAGLQQLETLSKLRKILQNANIAISSTASDGDTGYRKYTEKTINMWNCDRKPVIDFSDSLHLNDPLHLIKRGRYRLLSHKLVLLKRKEEELKIDYMKQILNLPSIVFDNHVYTKMHDVLPIKLFSIKNFDNLLYSELYKESAYFLPFVLLIEAVSDENLTIDERVDFIEIMCFYCQYFKQMYNQLKKGEEAYQIGSAKCILFDMNLIDDLISTGLVINSILNNFYGLVSLNRIGTNPLEHHFGLLRIRCKFQHNFDRFIREEKKVELLSEIEQMTIDNIVSERKKTFGANVLPDGTFHGEQSIFSNKDLALALMWKFGFPIISIRKVGDCFNENAYCSFLKKIKNAQSKHQASKHEYLLNSRDLSVGTSSTALIRQRFENDKIIKE